MKKHQNIVWHPHHLLNDLSPSTALRDWLLYQGSFMQRLKDFGVANAYIKVLRQDWRIPDDEERESLNIDSSNDVFVREVLIRSDDKMWVFARTVIPRVTLKGELHQLTQLENRPLGSVLFNIPGILRSKFNFADIQPNMQWYKSISQQLAQHRVTLVEHRLWARRSIFSLQEKSLLLTEVFLPDIETL